MPLLRYGQCACVCLGLMIPLLPPPSPSADTHMACTDTQLPANVSASVSDIGIGNQPTAYVSASVSA